MSRSKLAKLYQLSPLAAAIAFSATASDGLQAKSFTVDSQAALDAAIDKINEIEEGEASAAEDHTITFDASLSGESLALDSVFVYDGGSITLDGTAAEDLELRVLEGNDEDVGVAAGEGASITLKNLDIMEAGNANYGFVVGGLNGEGDTGSITLEGVNVSSPVFSEMYGEGAILALNTDLTITNSSFTGLSGRSLVEFGSSKYQENDSNELKPHKLTISNTTFNDNYTGNALSINQKYYSSGVVARLDNVSVDANELGNAGIRAASKYNIYGETFDLQITNTSITNSTSRSNPVIPLELGLDSYDEYAGDLAVELANITIADNEAEGGILAMHRGSDGGGSYVVESMLSLKMAHATITNNNPSDEWVEKVQEGYSAYYSIGKKGLYSYSPYTQTFAGLTIISEDSTENAGSSVDTEVEVVNSVISGHLRLDNSAYEEYISEGAKVLVGKIEDPDYPYASTLEDGDIYSDVPIKLRNSLYGVEVLDEDEESKISGKGNIKNQDPMLGELQDNGGVGLTIAPLKNSPLLDAGDSKFVKEYGLGNIEEALDQRGQARVQGDAPDLGAVEGTKTGPGDKKKDDDDLFGSLGFGSLFAAIGLVGMRRRNRNSKK